MIQQPKHHPQNDVQALKKKKGRLSDSPIFHFPPLAKGILSRGGKIIEEHPDLWGMKFVL